ncbi:hypothetical protein [Streptomyces virginiae]
MTDDNEFRNGIVSMTAAPPGWTIVAQTHTYVRETGERAIDEEHVFPVAAWAVVARHDNEGGVLNVPEAVFVAQDGGLEHESFYRWQYSDINPRPGEPKVTVSFKLIAPGT